VYIYIYTYVHSDRHTRCSLSLYCCCRVYIANMEYQGGPVAVSSSRRRRTRLEMESAPFPPFSSSSTTFAGPSSKRFKLPPTEVDFDAAMADLQEAHDNHLHVRPGRRRQHEDLDAAEMDVDDDNNGDGYYDASSNSFLPKRGKHDEIVAVPPVHVPSMEHALHMIAELMHNQAMREKRIQSLNRVVQELHATNQQLRTSNAQASAELLHARTDLQSRYLELQEKNLTIRSLQQQAQKCQEKLFHMTQAMQQMVASQPYVR